MEVVDGVHDLALTFERGDREITVHPAAVETRRGAILVDAGLPGATDGLRAALADADIDLTAVHDILLTHQDGDHVGGAPGVLDALEGIGVLAHREAVPYVEGDRDPVKGDPSSAPDPVDVDVSLVDRVRFTTRAGPMDVVHTPGHTPGHISLHFPEAGLLLAADAVVARDGHLVGPSGQHTADRPTALESVERLSRLAIDRTLCYHGGLAEEGSDRLAAVAENEEIA